jgi:hypothetical protein
MGIMGIGPAAGGALDALQHLMQQRMQQAQLLETIRSNQADEENRRQAIASAEATRQDAIQARREATDQASQDRADLLLARQIPLIKQGSLYSPEQAAPFQKAGYGGFFKAQPAQPFVGPLQEGEAPRPDVSPGGFEFQGTQPEEDAAAKREMSLAVAEARNAAEEARSQSAADRAWYALELQRRAHEDKVRPPDDPRFPVGVQEYVADLYDKYPTDINKAKAEFAKTLPQLMAAHPRLEAQRAYSAMRQVWARPYGSTSIDDIMAAAARGGGVAGAGSQGGGGGGGAPSAGAMTQITPQLREAARKVLGDARTQNNDARPVDDADVNAFLQRPGNAAKLAQQMGP